VHRRNFVAHRVRVKQHGAILGMQNALQQSGGVEGRLTPVLSWRVKPVGDGVSEMRIDYGPGSRVYFAERHGIVVILLRGGTKKTQQQDIKQAKRIYEEWKDQK
jgi:phage-related protein